MNHNVLRVTLVLLTSGLCYGAGSVSVDFINGAAGGNVTFTTTVKPPAEPFLSVAWGVNGANIITSTSVDLIGPGYENRITLDRSTGSLQLRKLTEDDSGEYELSIIPVGAHQIQGTTKLQVHLPVSNVVVTPNTTDLLEFNSSVSLSCSSSGSSLSYVWLNGSSEVTDSERVQLGDGGSTLTIVNVTRFDQGPFSCRVFNPISTKTSDPVWLSISYGPENTKLMLSPLNEYYEEGSDISLTCSAGSRPSAVFQWFLNGESLSHTGPNLTLKNIQINASGNYSCRAYNNKTMRYQASQSSAVTVLVPVSNVVVTPNTTDLLEFNSSVSLSCSSSGSSLSYVWLNGSSEVTDSERVQLGDGGSTLTIVNVTRFDQGPFSCRVFNPISTKTSDPVWLSISYGPENTKLTLSPLNEYYEEGSDISLTCSAVSRPSAMFQWFLNGESLSHTGPKLTLNNIQINASGNYSCRAYNNKTMRYQASQPSAVTVLAKVQRPTISCPTATLIEGKSSVKLTCDADGFISTREWMKDGRPLMADDRVSFYEDNRVLSINPVDRTDNVEFLCKVSNAVSFETAKCSLKVNYGPDKPTVIQDPVTAICDEKVTLTCSADSRPKATFTWMFDQEQTDGAVYEIDEMEEENLGSYTCTARNTVTGLEVSTVHTLKGSSAPLSGALSMMGTAALTLVGLMLADIDVM